MNKTDLQTLLSYSAWATNKLLAACEGITHEEFFRPLAPNPGWQTLWATLAHMLDAEYGWRCALQSQDSSNILTGDDFPNLPALQHRWQEEHAAWARYLASLPETNIHKGYGAEPESTMLVWQVVVHVVNHATQHRSEVAAFLTGLGHSPGELDFDLYLQGSPSKL